MDGLHFDDLIRALSGSRRSLVGGALGMAAGWLAVSDSDARKKRKRKDRLKKPSPNAYGCLNVGQACNGESAQCCSGLCEGTTPRKGKKDKSRCVAHGAGVCRAEFNSCLTNEDEPYDCGSGSEFCACRRTTGNADFCGTAGSCMDCTRDIDCEPSHGPGAACVLHTGFCEGVCTHTGDTACMRACPDTDM